MNKFIFITAFLTTVFISGCATVPIRIAPEIQVTNVEPSEEIRSSGIGDSMIEDSQHLVYEALDLKKDLEAGGGWQQKLFIPAQLLLASSEDEKFTYYFGDNSTLHDSLLGTRYITAGIKIRKKSIPGKDEVEIFGISPQTTFIKREEPIIEKAKATRKSDSGYNKKLIYAGKRDNYLIFKYVQSDNSNSGRDLQFDMEYDPSEGDIFSLKGASIRIVSHTSMKITYVVLSGFAKDSNIIN